MKTLLKLLAMVIALASFVGCEAQKKPQFEDRSLNSLTEDDISDRLEEIKQRPVFWPINRLRRSGFPRLSDNEIRDMNTEVKQTNRDLFQLGFVIEMRHFPETAKQAWLNEINMYQKKLEGAQFQLDSQPPKDK